MANNTDKLLEEFVRENHWLICECDLPGQKPPCRMDNILASIRSLLSQKSQEVEAKVAELEKIRQEEMLSQRTNEIIEIAEKEKIVKTKDNYSKKGHCVQCNFIDGYNQALTNFINQLKTKYK